MRKYLFASLLVTMVLIGMSCMAKPKVTIWGNTYPPKDETENIDVYVTALPTQEYIEIAQISCSDSDDNWNIQQILSEARKIGADGIIVTGRTGSMGLATTQPTYSWEVVPTPKSTILATTEYGMKAVAIEYKSQYQNTREVIHVD